jgi:putative FmdB family regulatory protein
LPTYGYRCPQCKFSFEVKLKFSDNNSPVFCARCGAKAERLFSPVPIIFKGSGFYITDNRRGEREAPSKGKAGKGNKEESEEDSR